MLELFYWALVIHVSSPQIHSNDIVQSSDLVGLGQLKMTLNFADRLLQLCQHLLVLMLDFGQVELTVELEVLFGKAGRKQAALEVKRLDFGVGLAG